MYRKYIKRFLDVSLSLVGLIVFFIPMIIISILIKIDSKGSVFFKQKRLGKNEKIFTVMKFRTMCENAYEMGGIVTRSDDKRITKIGSFLRRTSLDELPQMLNILKGEMSIIGPRPILDWEFDDFRGKKEYDLRHSVVPGLFCSVDIDYRASAERELQFEMDVDYVKNITFITDFKIFCGVIKTVFSGKNVYREEIKENEDV
ncbi:sugar transferase (plasmid) [Fusobacterium sp. SB021]|uniref:sugar transferase n=1 Tax=Fusobacterium sp. SB021 TaxID=2744227 RepID=UPI003CEAED5A